MIKTLTWFVHVGCTGQHSVEQNSGRPSTHRNSKLLTDQPAGMDEFYWQYANFDSSIIDFAPLNHNEDDRNLS